MRAIVCGGREFNQRFMLKAVLDRLHKRLGFTAVVESDEPGVARMAGDWARERGLVDYKFTPDLKLHRGTAHQHNNDRMIREADLAVVYEDGGPACTDMIARARVRGIKVYTVAVVWDWSLVFDKKRRKAMEGDLG